MAVPNGKHNPLSNRSSATSPHYPASLAQDTNNHPYYFRYFFFLKMSSFIEYDFRVGSEDPIWTDIAHPIQPAGFKVFFIK